jgi:hypothetical protein
MWKSDRAYARDNAAGGGRWRYENLEKEEVFLF